MARTPKRPSLLEADEFRKYVDLIASMSVDFMMGKITIEQDYEVYARSPEGNLFFQPENDC